MHACKKEEKKKESLKCSHDSMGISPSTFLQHHGGIVSKCFWCCCCTHITKAKTTLVSWLELTMQAQKLTIWKTTVSHTWLTMRCCVCYFFFFLRRDQGSLQLGNADRIAKVSHKKIEEFHFPSFQLLPSAQTGDSIHALQTHLSLLHSRLWHL